MEIVRTTFSDRVDEINTYYSFLVFMESGLSSGSTNLQLGNDSNLLIVFYVQIMPDDFVMQLHRF